MPCPYLHIRTIPPHMNYEQLFSARGKHVQSPRLAGVNYELTFNWGYPDPACLPNEAVLEAAERALRTHGQDPLQYGGAMGNPKFADQLVEKLRRDQKMDITRDNIMITSGSMPILGLMCDLFVNVGDTVIVEAPTFLGAVRVMKNAGAKVIGIDLDANGMKLDQLEAALAKLKTQNITPKFIYVIPNFQNPTGLTTPVERRQAIIALAKAYNTIILEDDAYYDLRFRNQSLPTMYSLAGNTGVVYMGTFSKILSPGMRLGWAVGEAGLIKTMSTMKVDGTSPFSTHIAEEFCKEDGLVNNIAKVRAIYAQRCEQMQDALSEFMPAEVKWTDPDGGFFVWLTAPEHVNIADAVTKARARGVDFQIGVPFFADGRGQNTARLSFSYVPFDQMARGIQIIAESIREVM